MGLNRLPNDILAIIFSMLPSKSIGICRCVSKEWNIALLDRQLIRELLTPKPPVEHLIITAGPSYYPDIYTIAGIKDGTVLKKLNLSGIWHGAMGSVDGLVLFGNDDHDEMLVVNPFTQQQVMVPEPPTACHGHDIIGIGFGYDSLTIDYKIVVVSSDAANVVFVDIFSLREGAWENAVQPSVPFPYKILFPTAGVSVNGAIHWLAGERATSRCFILAFDVVHKVFNEIPLPCEYEPNHHWLVLSRGCLGMVRHCDGMLTVWTMEKYRSEEGWTKLSVDARLYRDTFRYLFAIGPEHIGFAYINPKWRTKLLVYNKRNDIFDVLVVKGLPSGFVEGGTFMESLVSPVFKDFERRGPSHTSDESHNPTYNIPA